ncbi:MAG: tRNA 2-thiouridine(34) synthase MnmA [bacterium]|nr:tRNA 2-thiouridine(34) synthase MnmA [bacterium]
MERTKVVIGMSGGVDSSVAAWLLKEQGYEVLGVTMLHWGEGAADSASDFVQDAKRMAESIGIEHYVLDFRKEFRDCVMKHFAQEYQRGRTPNPCVLCNRSVKWEALLKRCRDLGAEYVATGHYAQVKQLPNGRFTIQVSATGEKDQTYALYRLTQEQLAHTLMPIGTYSKQEVRELAAKVGLMVADKPDSQEICFIPDHDHAKFIQEFTGKTMPEGNFVTKDGTILGRHSGITNYTIGQRRGLHIAEGHRVFVTEIRPESNEVVIGESEDLFTRQLVCDEVNWMAIDGLYGKLENFMRVRAKIRYAHKGAMCSIREVEEGVVVCEFDEAQRAITAGQAVVFYQDDYVVGGGTIRHSGPFTR